MKGSTYLDRAMALACANGVKLVLWTKSVEASRQCDENTHVAATLSVCWSVAMGVEKADPAGGARDIGTPRASHCLESSVKAKFPAGCCARRKMLG